jgi:hypothetical protein
MQALLTGVIILLAIAYLLAKWLPQKIKRRLQATLSKLHPGLGALFAAKNIDMGATCHSTCSSCSGCVDATAKPDTNDRLKTIRLIRHL